MEDNRSYYDCAIVGGGLAGLATAIQLAREGWRVVLFEKEKYPFHKVCGEYISLESRDFLLALGLPLPEWGLPLIDTLTVSAPGGRALTQALPLGGFGISRYRIEEAMAGIAQACGVALQDNAKVQQVRYLKDRFVIDSTRGSVTAAVCCGAFGKLSNLDIRWKRNFVQQPLHPHHNLIGVKYHARLPHPRHVIALHNFRNGYCGISPVEEDKYSICYLCAAHELREQGNDIRALEAQVLCRNPWLREAWARAEWLYERPLVISRISFAPKEQVRDHVLLLGDAAGMIAPLCGNGMSMALHSSKLAAVLVDGFLKGGMDRAAMEQQYRLLWRAAFARRLQTGRLIQSLFGKEWVTNLLIRALQPFPGITGRLIGQTHGQPF